MAAVVLVHGIAQEQLAAAVLERDWLPALAGGVANSGHQGLADRIWRGGARGDVEVRMAYYGLVFLDPGAQGGAAGPGPAPSPPAGDLAEELAEELAAAWLRAAAGAAANPEDRLEAQQQLRALAGDPGQPQGPRAALGRPALNALARIRWFAPFGMAVAGGFVWRALSQVSRYLTDDDTRAHAQNQVLGLIGPDTRLVIGHSLGSVVAYEALHRLTPAHSPPGGVTLITLGSPLGLANVVHQRLRPQPPQVPAAVNRWENIAAEDDLVAARLDLQPLFPPAPGSTTTPHTHIVDTGSQPHSATHYLTKPAVGAITAQTLTTP